MRFFRAFIVLTTLPALLAAAAPDKMAPIGSYLMERKIEIALARSAAPAAISGHAKVMVLTRNGYVAAVNGDNGFTCFVERAWANPFDMVPFWNPRVRAPTCLNPEASRSIWPYASKRTDLALAGATKEQIMARLTAAIADGSLPTPQPGAMSYMMSKRQYLNDEGKAWVPHVMFYAPKVDGAKNGADWGADMPRSPVVYDPDHHLVPEPWALFMIPVSHWSDGSPAPPYSGM